MTLKELIAEAHPLFLKYHVNLLLKTPDNFIVIDVREGTEIAETGSIPNAVNIPRGLIEMKLSPAMMTKVLRLALL